MTPHFLAAIVLLVQALALGFMMSIRFRGKMAKSSAECEKIKASKAFTTASGTQLNNAEWAPFFLICLIYLDNHGAGSAAAAYLAMGACVGYVVNRLSGYPLPAIAFGAYIYIYIYI